MNDQKDSLLIGSLNNEQRERPAVWMMRQAGRYLPEYREIRSRTTFLELCKTPELAAEVTVQPVNIVGVDAAIIFSDILVVPEAMGMHLVVEEGKGGPRFTEPLRSKANIDRLKIGVVGELHYVGSAIELTKKNLNGRTPVIGFAGAPLTLAAYMIEGAGSKNFDTFKSFIYNNIKLTEYLFEKLANELIEYLAMQIQSGANMIQLFDTWASLLPEDTYNELGLKYAGIVIKEVQSRYPDTPVLYFPKGLRSYDKITQSNAMGYGIDWQVSLQRALTEIPHNYAIQGNFDPVMLLTNPESIYNATQAMLRKVSPNRAYVANLGHGILPHTPVENAKAFIQAVKDFRF